MSMHTFHPKDTEYDLIAQEVLGKADLDAAQRKFLYLYVHDKAGRYLLSL